MWFGVLGPLLVRDGDSVTGGLAARQRVLLAALLVRAGAVVPADALAELMWDGSPPDAAVTTLRSHVMRLRRALGPAAAARVVTRYPGYVLEASGDEVDVLRFRGLCRDGGGAARAGEWARAWETLGGALGLWRGEPLADIPCELLRRDEAPGLEALRLQAAEWRMDAGLQLARHAELVPELQSLAGRHPLREPFRAQLMLALVRSGRQAEALEAYQHAREVLAEELGTEPGAELRELHQRILTADPSLAVPEPATPPGNHPGAVVPRELPAPVAGFVGRAEEMAALSRMLDRSGERTPGAIVISAIGGTAGVGKTALAVHWAHHVAERFPDGQLYVNLRGYDPDRPMTPTDALAGFLRALGVGGQDIPPEEDERAARYRSLLAGKRVLIVLDNARSVDQIRPLLPGSSACAVLITSRDSLAGLVAREGATRLEVDLLSLAEAVSLLQELIGTRAAADPGAAEALADRCCRLPLALRVAAELAAARPDVPLARLVDELADQQQRLDLLDAGGDRRTAVRAVFSWSYRHLDAGAAKGFRLAALHPGPDFDPYAMAALTGSTLQQARRMLDVLARAHLVQMTAPGRYGLHDLLRGYARELAADHDGDDKQHAALTRLFDHYLHTAAAAMDILYPAERYRRPRIPQPATPIPSVTDTAAARAWLDAERATLVAVTVHTAGRRWPDHATRLAATLFRYLDTAGHIPETVTIYTNARTVARRTGDRDAEATALNYLAGVHWRQGRCTQAISHLQEALALLSQTSDLWAYALGNLGTVYASQGRYEEAGRLHKQALAQHRATADRSGEAAELNALGEVELGQGSHHQATDHLQQSLIIAKELDNRHVQCTVLINLGTLGLRQVCYRQAADHLQRALALSRDSGYRRHEAEALTRLGDVYMRQGHAHEATGHLREALDLYRQIGIRSGEADALNCLGEVLLAIGQPYDAHTQQTTALGLASQAGDKYQLARAHEGLGRTYHATGHAAQARRHWRQALAVFTELGVPEADRVRALLGTAEVTGDASARSG